ncbi:hypothetical protein [Wenzhouxiangella sp. EGI_FJ10305]|uniref:hypothetical protein n=1 Tax=Wenzhouxiangella sp. EGI_FJ10305 TaxID=3243768 RepID=UPI0035DAA6AD
MKSSRSATTPDQRFVLYVPQLEPLLREAVRVPPLVDALVRKCRPRPLDGQSPQAELAAGLPLPAAPLTRRLDRPDDAGGVWLRADPVGLLPDLAAVWLQSDKRFEPGRWSSDLIELFGEESLDLELTEHGRGYLRLESPPDAHFRPPWTLAGNSLEHCLPEGPDAGRWCRLLNETQVLLHQHRQVAEHPATIPGSLWFWGGGELPKAGSAEPRVCRIVADDPILAGLADWLGLPQINFQEDAVAQPGSLVEWPSRFEESAEVNLDRLQSFLRPLWRQLRLGRIRELELAGIETLRRFSVADAWRIWR